jgi:sugar phosphate isomerase/epimerase
MKIGFSSLCCPTWDLRTILEQTVLMGYDGIELRGLQGELHLPAHPELAQNSDSVVEACTAMKVELVCVASSASFGHRKKHDVADQKAVVREYIELAEQLACPYVRVFTGDVPTGANRYETLGRIAEALDDLVHFASRHRVGLVIENSGELASSKDLWFLLDSVAHPALQSCWNPVNGLSVSDRSSIAIPRLGIRSAMIHLADARFEQGILDSYTAIGEGDVDVERLLELVQGLGFAGYLMAEWPKLWQADLGEPEVLLPAAAAYLRSRIELERKPLTAYKGDKQKPTFTERQSRTPRSPQFKESVESPDQ